MQFRALRRIWPLFFAACALFAVASQSYGETAQNDAAARGKLLDTPRFTLYFPSENSPVDSLHRNELAQRVGQIIDSTFEELTTLLQTKPQGKVVFRFLSPEEFRERTGAPAWTSAMFLHGEISIPIPDEERVNLTEIYRAIRHEYVHAVVADLSNRKCPAWFDEGLAQLFEGEANPLLGPALRKWVHHNDAMPLDWLHNGFMTLDNDLVAVAYAESLFAVRFLVNAQGFTAVRGYLSSLAAGNGPEDALRGAFQVGGADFEKQLTLAMRSWSAGAARNP